MLFGWREFLFGLVAAAIVLFILWKIRFVFSGVIDWIRKQSQSLRRGLTTRAIDRYQVEMISRAETMHLARAIFALDEILIPPRILVPPPPTDPTSSSELPTNSLSVVPNLPDFVFLSGVYVAPTLSLEEALRDGADLLITGGTGSGRSTALAYLAIRLANRSPEMGSLVGKVPILIHAADLALGRFQGSLPPLIEAAQRAASPGVAALLPSYIQKHFDDGNALLLLDGLDVLGHDDLTTISSWLRELRTEYTGIRMVAAGSATSIGGIGAAGLAPVAIAPWSELTQRRFMHKWAHSWQEFVVPQLPKNRAEDVELILINGWLAGTMRGKTPAEVTARVWAAYSGDNRGQRSVDDFEAYASRLLSPGEQVQAEAVALTWLRSGTAAIAERSLPKEVSIPSLMEAGVLARHEGGTVSFVQPVVGAYLGARAMARQGVPENLGSSRWEPAQKAMQDFAALGNAEPEVTRALLDSGDPLASRLLACARWLPDAPNSAEWRGKLLREIAKLVSDASKPYGLRLRCVHALAGAAEESVAILFARMLKSGATSTRVVAALGLGGLADEGSVEGLVVVAQSDPELLVRQAACLALGAIGSDAALEGLGHALLGGDQELRLAAAEALAVHPDEGFGMLREAAEHDEIMTRRAAVFGLARVLEKWAIDALKKVQVDDQEWIVRGAASEALERRAEPPWKVHPPPVDISQLSWVAAYAEKVGLAIGSGKASVELLRKAINEGSTEEKVAALETLSYGLGEQIALEFYKALESGNDYLRDAAFEALWRLATTGANLPDPLKFGF
jgi:HEAT repeat protein